MRVPGSALLTAAALAVALAVAPAAASADPACPDSDLQPTAANLAQVESATLCMINVQRSQHGLAPLTANSVLQSAAIQHSANILNGKFKELGVGVEPSTPSGDPTGATFTADFGARASNPVGVANKPKSHKHPKHKRVRHKRAKHRKHHKKHGGCSSTRNSAVSLC
jgi:uncharacterized protein YkwD